MGTVQLNKNSVGADGERMAVKFLKKKSYKIIERNWCNKKGKRIGEVDIIAQDKEAGVLVFVEVKTRQIFVDDGNTLPEEQITPGKLQKLQRIAEVYIKEHDLWDAQWRIDAVSVLIVDGEEKPRIEHIESIFL